MQNLHRVKNHGESVIEIETEGGERLELAPGRAIVCAPVRIRTPRIGGGAWEIEPADPAGPIA